MDNPSHEPNEAREYVDTSFSIIFYTPFHRA